MKGCYCSEWAKKFLWCLLTNDNCLCTSSQVDFETLLRSWCQLIVRVQRNFLSVVLKAPQYLLPLQVGRDFLPRGPEICTRRPLVLQLVRCLLFFFHDRPEKMHVWVKGMEICIALICHWTVCYFVLQVIWDKSKFPRESRLHTKRTLLSVNVGKVQLCRSSKIKAVQMRNGENFSTFQVTPSLVLKSCLPFWGPARIEYLLWNEDWFQLTYSSWVYLRFVKLLFPPQIYSHRMLQKFLFSKIWVCREEVQRFWGYSTRDSEWDRQDYWLE